MLARFIHHFLTINRHLCVVYLLLLAFVMAGSAAISFAEKVSFGKAVYFSLITGLTVGYGDIVPTTGIGQIISILLGFVGILTMGIVVAASVESVRRAWEDTEGQKKPNDE